MLHPSLTDLSESAPLCADIATVRGVLAESLDLLGNALQHGEDPAELAGWLSRLITDALHSPGILTEVVLTGPVGRGDALPTSPIRWLAIVDKPEADDPNPAIAELLSDVGLLPEPIGYGTRSQWEQRAKSGSDTAAMLDAGTWVASITKVDAPAMLKDALSARPPALEVLDGLPSRDVGVNIREDLMVPTVKIARWAAHVAGSTAPTTSQRLIDAHTAGILNTAEADALTQVWKSALELQSKRWMNHVHDRQTTAWDMTALERSTFGAAARMLSEVIRALDTRHGK